MDHVLCLLCAQGLDKTQIGDYLGEREDFNIRVMHAYVDMLDFVGLEFDAAIRLFLAGFRYAHCYPNCSYLDTEHTGL